MTAEDESAPSTTPAATTDFRTISLFFFLARLPVRRGGGVSSSSGAKPTMYAVSARKRDPSARADQDGRLIWLHARGCSRSLRVAL